MATTVVIGGTGMVGSHILSTLLEIEAVKSVHTISRREPKCEGAKLSSLIEGDSSKWAAALSALKPAPEVVLSALGTTRAAAGGIADQWKIDHDLNIELARAARASGVRTFVFVSSAGTRGPVGGWLPYSRMKIGVEDEIRSLGFDQAVLVRPGFILGEREPGRAAGAGAGVVAAAIAGLGRVSPALADRFGQDAPVIARAAVRAALLAQDGKAPSRCWVLEQADIVKYGRDEYGTEASPAES